MSILSDLKNKDTINFEVVMESMVNAINVKNWETVDILKKFNDSCRNVWGADWDNNEVVLINSWAFRDYAYDLMQDMFNIPKELSPYIDVELFASDLKLDCGCVTLEGRDFWGNW